MSLSIVRARRALLGAALAFGMLPSGADAHAMLHGSDPADGAILVGSPRTINLTFSEPCRITSLRLLDASGQERPLRRADSRGMVLNASAAPTASLAPGDYRLEWRAMGDDGHVMSGAVRFTVNAAR